MIRYFDFSHFHGKPMQGSTYIRMVQMEKYWPQLGEYKYGENPEALIFQKVYCTPDYKFPAHFENTKILDICDPDWFDGAAIRETIEAVDAITVPSAAMREFIEQMTDKPCIMIPDRWDMEYVPKIPKRHKGLARKVVWFGYSHNAVTLRPALRLLAENNLCLMIISNDDPLIPRFSNYISDEKYEFHKFPDDRYELYDLLRQADFAILPRGTRPIDRFKSNNKDTQAILAGLPVAKDEDEVRLYMSAKERNKFVHEHYDRIKKEYDVRESVREYQELISEIKAIRN